MITFSPSLPMAALFRSDRHLGVLDERLVQQADSLESLPVAELLLELGQSSSAISLFRYEPGGHRGDLHGHIVGERLEVLGACHKIGFAIDLHERGNAAAAVDVELNDALLRCRPAFFSAFASPCCIRSDCALRTCSVELHRRPLAFHDACSGQVLSSYLCRANRHDLLFSIMCSRQSIDGMLPMGSAQTNRQERRRRWHPAPPYASTASASTASSTSPSDILDCIVDSSAFFRLGFRARIIEGAADAFQLQHAGRGGIRDDAGDQPHRPDGVVVGWNDVVNQRIGIGVRVDHADHEDPQLALAEQRPGCSRLASITKKCRRQLNHVPHAAQRAIEAFQLGALEQLLPAGSRSSSPFASCRSRSLSRRGFAAG